MAPAALLCAVLLPFGSVHASSRLVVHLVAGFILLFIGIMWRSVAVPVMTRLLTAWCLVIGAMALSTLAAGSREGLPAIEVGLHKMATMVIPVSVAAIAAVATSSSRRRTTQLGLLVIPSFLLVVAGVHHAAGVDGLLGVWEPDQRQAALYLPLVNPNHFAVSIAAFAPVAFSQARTHRSPRVRAVAGTILTFVVCTVLAVGAAGPIVALAAVAAIALLWRRPMFGAIGFVAGAPVLGWATVSWASSRGSDALRSAAGRVHLWQDLLRGWSEHALLGHGPGRFQSAISPFRTDHSYQAWGHAHSDVLEWLFENGVVGAVALFGALALITPLNRRYLTPPLLASSGVLLCYAIIDFPFQIPALSALALTLYVLGAARRGQTARTPFGVVAGVLATLNLGAAVVAGHEVVVNHATGTLPDATATNVLSVVAPWRPEVAIAATRVRAGLLEKSDPAFIESYLGLYEDFPRDPAVIGVVARSLTRAGHHQHALPLTDVLVELEPWNRRQWALRATVHTRVDPSSCAPAWADALRAGVPGALDAGWLALPEGLVWVEAIEHGTAQDREQVARFLDKKDEVGASLVLYQQLTDEDNSRWYPHYLKLLRRHAMHTQALEYVTQVREHRPSDNRLLREHADLLGSVGRHSDSADLWLRAWRDDEVGLGRAVEALARAGRPEEGLRLWERERLAGGQLTPDDYLRLAAAQLAAGLHGDCRATIQGHRLTEHASAARRARALLAQCAEPTPR